MYVPASFSESDRRLLFDFIDAYGFATLVSWSAGDQPAVSHVPLLIDQTVPGRERLLGHVARANPHWQLFDGRAPALAIFAGPHGYVSPSWYVTRPTVPTWNYAVVHVTGAPRVVDAAATRTILDRLVEQYEAGRPDRWPGDLPPDYLAEQLEAIVGFEIPIDRVEGKFKLGQNREPEDLAGALAGLDRASDSGSRMLAEFTRYYNARKKGD